MKTAKSSNIGGVALFFAIGIVAIAGLCYVKSGAEIIYAMAGIVVVFGTVFFWPDWFSYELTPEGIHRSWLALKDKPEIVDCIRAYHGEFAYDYKEP